MNRERVYLALAFLGGVGFIASSFAAARLGQQALADPGETCEGFVPLCGLGDALGYALGQVLLWGAAVASAALGAVFFALYRRAYRGRVGPPRGP